MTPLYPEETRKLDVISHLEELRRRILICLGAVAAAALISLTRGEHIMHAIRAPLKGLTGELIFISPTEGFISYIKVAFLTGFVAVFPVILFQVWAFVSPAFPRDSRKRIFFWLLFGMALFFSGVIFAYYVAIPASLRFLLGFGSEIAVPRISLGRYISFFGALILVGGITFEIPVFIGFLTDTGILRTSTLRKKRHYAILSILVFAAVITPTQDIFNLLLFSLPMILLYETGILLSRIMERGRGDTRA